MLWLKAFHIVFVIAWFSGIFYLPRLFVYHASTEDTATRERFKIMERRLFGMMTLGALLAVTFGAAMVVRAPSFGSAMDARKTHAGNAVDCLSPVVLSARDRVSRRSKYAQRALVSRI
jgi:uncharacterized membrane protein